MITKRKICPFEQDWSPEPTLCPAAAHVSGEASLSSYGLVLDSWGFSESNLWLPKFLAPLEIRWAQSPGPRATPAAHPG